MSVTRYVTPQLAGLFLKITREIPKIEDEDRGPPSIVPPTRRQPPPPGNTNLPRWLYRRAPSALVEYAALCTPWELGVPGDPRASRSSRSSLVGTSRLSGQRRLDDEDAVATCVGCRCDLTISFGPRKAMRDGMGANNGHHKIQVSCHECSLERTQARHLAAADDDYHEADADEADE